MTSLVLGLILVYTLFELVDVAEKGLLRDIKFLTSDGKLALWPARAIILGLKEEFLHSTRLA